MTKRTHFNLISGHPATIPDSICQPRKECLATVDKRTCKQRPETFERGVDVSECALMSGCPFFKNKMPDLNGLSEVYRLSYCLGDHSHCARFMVARQLGPANVPADLYPHMTDRANEIAGQKKTAV